MKISPKKTVSAAALAACVAGALLSTSVRATDPWSFGVLSDTQWTVADDGKNPNTIAANIIKQIDQQFISAQVKLVVDVGDMLDNTNEGSLSGAALNTYGQNNDYARALYAQDLYNAGIGFYPMRGNHEAANGNYTNSGMDFLYAYPQITNGVNNSTPTAITTSVLSAQENLPAAKTGSPFTVGTNFSSPATNATTGGVSYAFQYNNATFVSLDQFNGNDYYSSTIPAQEGWIDSTLSGRPAGTQAFVFTHKNILGGNHKDNMFGPQVGGTDPGDGSGVNVAGLSPADQATLAAKQTAENNFLASMQTNNVKYVVSGHDHHEYDSIVKSPDGTSQVHQLITASDSSKFYAPASPTSANDTPIQQQLSRVGYNIFTVDGPRVTINYYADTTANNYSGPFNFQLQSTMGYSLNGIEKVIPQSGSYTAITDSTANAVANQAAYGETGYRGTTMAILAGTNGSVATTNYGKAESKAVDTGWAPAGAGQSSDQLFLWGMADLAASSTDTYVLSMSYDPATVSLADASSGALRMLSKNAAGNWIDAVDGNTGGVKQFFTGAYQAGYGLGSYGVDTSTDTAWAVVNHASAFVVATPEPASLAVLGLGAAALMARRRRRRA